MVEDGLVKCNDCEDGFDNEDTIHECGKCQEIFCESCWEDHNCIEDEYDEPTVTCEECHSDVESSEAKYCNECYKIICDSCWDDHCHEHLDNDKEEYDYEDYVDQKVKEAI